MHPVRKREMGDTALSYAVGNKGAEFSLAGLPSPHREHLLNWGPAATAAALPSPSSLTRCHLSQSERLWQSAKFPILYFTPCCRKGAVRRYAETSRLCQGLPLWESWREAPERASPAEVAQGVGLDSANDGADFQKAQSKLTRCVLVSVLALSVIAPRCHLSQSERPWQSAKFPVLYFTPCCHKKSRQALHSDFTPLPRAPTLGELARSA